MDVSVDIALKVAEIVSIVAGGGTVAYRLGRTTERMEQAMAMQREQIISLKDDVKELNKLMTDVALQKQRLDMHAAQLAALEELRLRSLAHRSS